MKFGVFDHLDNSGRPLHEFFEHRLRLIESYERLGFLAYHTAEHHATPLGMAPSPSLLHAAIAQRTKRIRFGPLVYTLNLYHPLRLAEEICMLDHMSGGRFIMGVGRGISPIELKYYGADPELGQAMYVEAYEVIMKALTSDILDHAGRFYQFKDVPIVMRPLQQPHPPVWYGIGNPESVGWYVDNKVNVITNAPAAIVRSITSRFREEWAKRGMQADALPFMGTTRHMVIAPTDAEAIAIARRAYAKWYDSFIWLWKKHNAKPRFALYTEDFDSLMANGQAIAGSPDTVRKAVLRLQEEFGGNYLLCRFAFGDLSFDESLRSAELFAVHVMPAFD
jgi:alkanesulfonate monooxygenase SsuD/methylene tetrahydromethanopterin reductase-like flavin-dependent oxidoreductase (luciferase family)